MRVFHWILIFVASLMLAACGGGDKVCYGGPGSDICDTDSASTASALSIQLSTTSIDNSGSETVTATATATSSSGQTVAGAPSLHCRRRGGLHAVGTETDSTGVVTAAIGIGATSPIARAVVATSGTLSATVFTVKGEADGHRFACRGPTFGCGHGRLPAAGRLWQRNARTADFRHRWRASSGR
jgi:hypothetical protein